MALVLPGPGSAYQSSLLEKWWIPPSRRVTRGVVVREDGFRTGAAATSRGAGAAGVTPD